ncbi:ABC transporter permease [Psychrosphaera algicola]|uniref:ABC transporter permease n=2 Tax=Psychrosphaera TaxID=907197 RepID=A0ABT5F9G7_9GAMM|nr:ABC transporter permease [Psychrosphaera sp. G1-22]MDC2888041.1 ABC transporter permease [Psychrosphaera sp. G1-22]
MQIPISLYIASRYAKASQGGKFIGFISLFSTLGIALGVMALIIVVSVMDGFEGLLKQRMLGAVPHITITAKQHEANQVNNQNDFLTHINQTIDSLGLNDHVIQTLPLVQSQAIVQMPADLKGMIVQGIQDTQHIPVAIKNFIVQGDWQNLLDKRFGIVIGRYLAMEFGLGIGDQVRIIVSGASHYTPLGRMPAQRKFTVVGIFETESEIDQQLILSRSEDLNRLMRKPKTDYEAIRLVLNDPFIAQNVSQQLTSQLPAEQYSVENWHKTHGKLFDAVKMEKNMMWFMLSLIIAVAAFNIVSSLVMMVTKKQGEIAILKT